MKGGAWLALPLALLLFLQWPLRDLVQAYSRQANDIAQILFALFVAIAFTEATRRDAHLAADALAARYPLRARRIIARVAAAVVVLPWALFLAVTSAPVVWQSLLQLERFADTLDPGYFLVRFSALLLAALALIQSVLDVAGRGRASP
jgi:TRAP-type C4-dicarboxylate transport system permease small subunit